MRDDLLLIKGHFFFFFAALGPILPFLSVLGKQLGISEIAMGLIYTIVPIFYFPAKTLFGFIMDCFVRQRTFVFTLLVYLMGLFYLLIYFVPSIPMQKRSLTNDTTCLSSMFCDLRKNDIDWTVHQMCSLSCENGVQESNIEISIDENHCSLMKGIVSRCNISQANCDIKCEFISPVSFASLKSLCQTRHFWIFVVLITCGLISFNIVNTMSDTICLNALGNGNESQYGKLRLWGSVGYGITAFMAGFYIDHLSRGSSTKNNTPAFIFFMFFIALDIIVCSKLKMVPISSPRHIPKEIWEVLKKPNCAIFYLFTLLLGMFDGFAIYYLFLYVEELAKDVGLYDKVRLIEGLTVLVQSLGGEILVFFISDRLFRKVGYETAFALCFLFFAIRFCAIAFMPSPWWVIPIETILHGLTYALAYSVVVAYTSSISTVAIRGTMQGIATGIYDGIGYSMAGLTGGTLCFFMTPLKEIFKVYGFLSFIFGVSYYSLYIFVLRKDSAASREVVYIVPEDLSKTASPLSEG